MTQNVFLCRIKLETSAKVEEASTHSLDGRLWENVAPAETSSTWVVYRRPEAIVVDDDPTPERPIGPEIRAPHLSPPSTVAGRITLNWEKDKTSTANVAGFKVRRRSEAATALSLAAEPLLLRSSWPEQSLSTGRPKRRFDRRTPKIDVRVSKLHGQA